MTYCPQCNKDINIKTTTTITDKSKHLSDRDYDTEDDLYDRYNDNYEPPDYFEGESCTEIYECPNCKIKHIITNGSNGTLEQWVIPTQFKPSKEQYEKAKQLYDEEVKQRKVVYEDTTISDITMENLHTANEYDNYIDYMERNKTNPINQYDIRCTLKPINKTITANSYKEAKDKFNEIKAEINIAGFQIEDFEISVIDTQDI